MEILELGVRDIRQKVTEGDLTALEVTQAYLKQCEKLQPQLNAMITISGEEAQKRAKQVDEDRKAGKSLGLLAGVPVAVKDALLNKGVRATAGSKILENFVAPYSSTVVEKLEAAGAIVIGKANMDEFAMGGSNENSAYGPVKNPWDLSRVAGGSSGGSAAAVAARMAPISIGTDTGGSIREPAHFCGVVGVKPTYGRVSRYGVVAFASSLDQVGPFGRSVEDAATVLEVISGKDKRDSTSATEPVPEFSKNLEADLKGLKVGLPKEFFVDSLSPNTKETLKTALGILKDRGAETVEVDLPLTKYGVAVYYIVAPCEASANLSRYDGIRYGYRDPDAQDLNQLYKMSRGKGFGAEPKRRIMLGTFALSSGYYDAYYNKACQVRRLIKEEYQNVMKQCDVLLGPVTTGAAFKLGAKSKDPLEMYLNDLFTIGPSLAGLPGLSVNAGFTDEGMPLGVQIIARRFDEQKMLQVAHRLETELNLLGRKPNEL